MCEKKKTRQPIILIPCLILYINCRYPALITYTALPPGLDIHDFPQEAHRDDPHDFALYNYSLIINISEEDAVIRVCKGSHQFSGVEQLEKKMGDQMEEVRIPKGKGILFSRQLLHSGTAYLNDHERFFCFVDMFPPRHEGYIYPIFPNDTSKYINPPSVEDKIDRLTRAARRRCEEPQLKYNSVSQIALYM